MSDNIRNSQRIAKNTVYMFFRMFLVTVVGLYTSRVVLATLGVSDFGIYNVVGGVVVLFSFLKNALNNATYRYLAVELGKNNDLQLKKTFSMAVNVHVILAIIILALGEIIGVWILNAKLNIPEGREFAANIVFQISMLSFCISVVQTPYNSAIVVHERMNFYAYTSIVEVCLKLAIAFSLPLFLFDKLIVYGILTLCVSVIMFSWYIIQCRRLFDECHYQRCWDSSLAKGMSQYSGWSIVVNIVDVLVNQSIVFFFNTFFGVIANAAMGVANQVNSQLTNFLNTFTQSYNPQIIKSYAAEDRTYFLKLIFFASKFSFFLLLFVAGPLLLNIDFILNLWLKNPPEGSSLFLILIVAYSLVDAYSAPLWTGVHATGQLRTHQIIMSSIKVLNIPIAYFLLKMGCAAWTALMLKVGLNIVCSVVRPFYVQKLYDLPLLPYMKNVLAVVYIVSIITLFPSLYVASFFEPSLTRLIFTSSSFIVVFTPTVLFVGLSKNERSMMFSVIQSKFFKKTR